MHGARRNQPTTYVVHVARIILDDKHVESRESRLQSARSSPRGVSAAGHDIRMAAQAVPDVEGESSAEAREKGLAVIPERLFQ